MTCVKRNNKCIILVFNMNKTYRTTIHLQFQHIHKMRQICRMYVTKTDFHHSSLPR